MANRKATSSSVTRIGTRYRNNRLRGPYDAIVIGSGLGGLSSASALAKSGKKVLVLEQHYTAGGFTHTYDREGYEWDPGVHYVGKMGHDSFEKRIFDYVTDGKVKWSPLDKNFDRFYMGEEQYDFFSGRKDFVKSLKAQFPDEGVNIDRYMKKVITVTRLFKLTLTEKFLSPKIAGIYSSFIKKALPSYFYKTTYDVLIEITQNENLIALLTAQWGTFGVPPKSSSFHMHCLIQEHYLDGAYYPVGGSLEIAKAIIPVIQAEGGDVFTYARVENIIVANGRATGVKMSDGHEILASTVISNAGVTNTFKHLLPEQAVKKWGYDEKLKGLSPSTSNISLFVGVKEDAKSLNLPNRNIWIYPDGQHDKNVNDFETDQSKEFGMFISFPSTRDPSFSQRHPGRSTITMITFLPFSIFEKWDGTIWGKRGEDYEKLKEHYSQRMLSALYEKLPQLEGKIDYYEAGTPLTTQYYSDYQSGETYGLKHDSARFEQNWLTPQTKIPGLYLTGQDVLACGVVTAAATGLMTASNVLGWQSWKILKSYLNKPFSKGIEPEIIST